MRIVDMARREINAKTDIAFEYEEIKEGRKVVALRFRITKNPRADTPDPLRDDPRLARLVARLTAHGMAEEAARAIVQAHEPELVEWATSDLARRLKGKEKIENPAGWLRKAIEEDWRPQPTLFAQEQAQARENEQKAERERLDQEVKTAEGRKADAAREKAAIMAFIDGLPEDERQALEQGFREHLASTVPAMVAKRFAGGETWCADPIIRAEAIAYLPKNLEIRQSKT
ncbi:protein involved in initiation of plasmid replication [Paramagnetospirillum caucaseum]|uniref:Protein involved in initiation of plasmid replication n=1 Tax=Paramagnetospirillum caucaseum TaxID=1244869 RepID=M3A8L3_9PROT|nr:protein involved in initiation of plasmid replication [Paramagnetospirillum caucaseum]